MGMHHLRTCGHVRRGTVGLALAALVVTTACGDDGEPAAAAAETDEAGGTTTAAATDDDPDRGVDEAAVGDEDYFATFRGEPVALTSSFCREQRESEDAMGWVEGGGHVRVRHDDARGLQVEMYLPVAGGESDWLNGYTASDWHEHLPDVGDQVTFGPDGSRGELELEFTGTSNSDDEHDTEGGLLSFNLPCED